MSRQTRELLLTVWAFSFSSLWANAADAPPEPRYIFFNVAGNPQWEKQMPQVFEREIFDEIRREINAPENPQLRIGVSLVISTLETPAEMQVEGLKKFFQRSEETGMPIMLALDGQNWWNTRPDLWNWWDPDQPGYNPSNVYNVEWTGWDPATAVKIGWRNWGRQIRVKPAPNLASQRVVEEHVKRLRLLVPVIAEWRRTLPDDRKYLFGGLKVGWESGIGQNAFYYPDGNRYLEQWPDDPSHDPQHGLNKEAGLGGGVAQLGYAAVKTAGIKSKGKITRDDIGKVVQQYLAALARAAHEAGLPRELIYTHQGGTGEPWDKHLPFWPAFNEWSNPGWSFYGVKPDEIELLEKEFKRQGRDRWGASEWWIGAPGPKLWEENFRRTLKFRDCRYVCVYNWNHAMFKDTEAGKEAVRNLVATWKE